ncbi:Hypothetical predicted protein [Marmota monax]|uniref:EVA1 domain-containing protein n=1 Tax=Marmota monax TaxID=9995 RepID=A0A5E4BMM4_MARMO|nr:Hypothetical predicted protein [Marmota monax]
MQNPRQQSPFRKPLSARSEEIPHSYLRMRKATLNKDLLRRTLDYTMSPLVVSEDDPVGNLGGPGPGINLDPSESKVLWKDGVIVSNSLAAFAYIRAHPERAALLFVSSVCIGLTLTLCALVIRVSCTKDFQELQLGREHLVPGGDRPGADSEEEAEEEDSSDSEFPGELAGFCRTSYPAYSSVEAAELAERIERREQIIQEIWMNSGLDTSLPRNMSHFY